MAAAQINVEAFVKSLADLVKANKLIGFVEALAMAGHPVGKKARPKQAMEDKFKALYDLKDTEGNLLAMLRPIAEQCSVFTNKQAPRQPDRPRAQQQQPAPAPAAAPTTDEERIERLKNRFKNYMRTIMDNPQRIDHLENCFDTMPKALKRPRDQFEEADGEAGPAAATAAAPGGSAKRPRH